MSLIEWKDEFSVGVDDVDHEHRELIELINELYAAATKDTSSEEIIEFLGEIYANISAHFALEEKIMREARYDEYELHKADHETLLDEIRDMMDDYEEENKFSDDELSERLSDWFANHFKNMDARLHNRLG